MKQERRRIVEIVVAIVGEDVYFLYMTVMNTHQLRHLKNWIEVSYQELCSILLMISQTLQEVKLQTP